MNNIQIKNALIPVALVALMAATRMHHFGSGTHLPDASLAVFLLAGFLIASPAFFAALLMVAAALDYTAVTQFGVDNYCITPAYGFLIPTYAVLWFAGRTYSGMHQDNLRSLGLFSALSLLAVNLAFVISNGSFYLFSGKFADMSVSNYAASMAQYYVPYVSGAVIYLIPAIVIYAVSRTAQPRHA